MSLLQRNLLYHFPTWFIYNLPPFVPSLKKKKWLKCLHLSLENNVPGAIINLLNILLNTDNLHNTDWKYRRIIQYFLKKS